MVYFTGGRWKSDEVSTFEEIFDMKFLVVLEHRPTTLHRPVAVPCHVLMISNPNLSLMFPMCFLSDREQLNDEDTSSRVSGLHDTQLRRLCNVPRMCFICFQDRSEK
nr:hypothetical protein CFP56_72102 [Quercus suber]